MPLLLDIKGLHAGYGASDVLHDVAIAMEPGSFHALIGANGAGKSTTMKALSGLLRPVRGSIAFAGEDIARLPAARIVSKGFALVPEGRRVFGPLSVKDNLQMGAFTDLFPRRKGNLDDRLAFVLSTFPRLEERLSQAAGTLSGGEQQMLAIGRALMTNPTLLILDEATEGLAPLVRAEIWACLGRLKAEGLSLIVIDKNIGPLLRLADRHFIVEKGRVVWHGRSEELRAQPELLSEYVGI